VIAVSQSGSVEKQFDALSDLRVSFAGDLHVVKNFGYFGGAKLLSRSRVSSELFFLGGAVVKNRLFD
jgi:hypothetical protein